MGSQCCEKIVWQFNGRIHREVRSVCPLVLRRPTTARGNCCMAACFRCSVRHQHDQHHTTANRTQNVGCFHRSLTTPLGEEKKGKRYRRARKSNPQAKKGSKPMTAPLDSRLSPPTSTLSKNAALCFTTPKKKKKKTDKSRLV